MSKLDLIIDALDVSESLFYDQTKLQEALQSARELKALKPAVKVVAENGGVCFELLDKKLPVGTLLYTMEVTK